MQIKIEGTLITSGFVSNSKAGLSLFVNTSHKSVDLCWTSCNDDYAAFGFVEDDVDSTITFTPENDVEQELLSDVCRFTLANKDQWQFLFVKWDQLEEYDDHDQL